MSNNFLQIKMEFHCDICNKKMNHKSKNNHLKSLTHNQYEKCFLKKRNLNNPNFFDIDKFFNDYIITTIKNWIYIH